MPDFSQWRDDAAYAYFDDLDTEGLAWECLRRNESYQAEIGRMTKHAAKDTDDDICRLHWGLRFRDVAEPHRARRCHFLGAGSQLERRSSRDISTHSLNGARTRDDIAAR